MNLDPYEKEIETQARTEKNFKTKIICKSMHTSKSILHQDQTRI